MSYRIVRVTILYPDYLAKYYATHQAIVEEPFERQYDDLLNDSVDIVASITRNLRSLGVEAFAIFTNAEPLQSRWKLENNCKQSGRELVFEQIKSLKPDVLWLDDTSLFDRKWISYAKKNIPSIRIMTGHMCSPYNTEILRNLESLDFLTTCTPCLKDEFENAGIKSHLVYHSFERNILNKLPNLIPSIENDLVFTGSLFTGGGFHKTRIEYLEYMLLSNLPLKIYGKIEPASRIAKKMAAYPFINAVKKIKAAKA